MLSLLAAFAMSISPQTPVPLPPVPSARQMDWHQMGQYAFIHFGPNTFTDQEWGGGKEDPKLFNPSAFDARQWAKAVKAGGLKGIILTAKHHDGFCLWPSKFSTHTVAQSPFKGDVLKSVSDACRAEGLKFGVYLSPWDRNHPTYGTPEYNKVFANMLREVLTHYGPVFEVWFDGANGEGPNGKKQVYDWKLFIDTVRECQPKAVIFSDAGPDIRWVGNEGGFAEPTNWATIDRDRYVPGTPLYQELTEGKRGGKDWVPAECDVSIRPGWFYHKEQDDKVKTPAQLLDLWERSVGQNSNFLLNIPPDRRGLFAEPDVAALKGFAALREATYARDLATGARVGASTGSGAGHVVDGKGHWSAPAGETKADLTVELKAPTMIDRVELREPIEWGQRIAGFTLEVRSGSRWQEVGHGTTVGNRRIVRIEPVLGDAVRVRITDALATPLLSRIALYASPGTLKAELAAMEKEDQSAREGVMKDGKPDVAVIQRMMAVDAKHLVRMKALLAERGFPRKSVYGEETTHNFWLLVQHMDQDVAFQQEALRQMKALAKEKEVLPVDLAYLEDRVLVNTGKPQIYGTQDGKPIEKPEQVDERRAALGMIPLAAYQRMLNEYKTTGKLPGEETPAEKDARMAWWREARFGMFIHWGIYSIAAGSWNGVDHGNGAEWIMNTAKVPVKEYEPIAKQWNPTKFDAREWVRIAKDAGMKYIVITSKHHDGFGLWPSKQNDWNVGRTTFKRDVLKELASACKDAGIRLCFYHSIMDWHHPDYLPKRPWDREGEAKADFDRYVVNLKAQLKELLTNYGDIGILWFDGEWEGTWTHERGQDLYNFVRSIQPNIIVNNRVDTGRAGMAGGSSAKQAGDYGTPEQEIPANGMPGTDWESCMTMNDTWGFRQSDNHWKSSTILIRNLIDCASKGGNYLLNVGPTAEGLIPAASVERLAEMGRWTKANGEAIYGTTAGPFPKALPWGRVTRKGDRLYLHVFEGDRILLPGLKTNVVSVKTLAGGKDVPFKTVDNGVEVDLTGIPRDPSATVLRLDFQGPLEVAAVLPRQSADRSLTLLAADATIHGATARLQGDNIGYWIDPKDTVSWEFDAVRGEVQVEIEYACEKGSEGATFAVEIGGQRLTGTVESTGSWSEFRRVKLGKVALVVPGKTEVIVRPLSKPGQGVMNLRAIRLN